MILIIEQILLLYSYNIYDDNIIQLILKQNKYILRDIFDTYKNKLNVKYLSANCNALDLLLEPEYIHKISIDRLCEVQSTNLSKTLCKLYYNNIYDFKVFLRNKGTLSKNQYAIDFITENPRCVNYDNLARNKMAKDLLLYLIPILDKKRIEKYGNYFFLFLFRNENMMEYVANNIQMLSNLKNINPKSIANELSSNPNCFEFWKIRKTDFNNIINNITLVKLLDNYIDLQALLCNENINNISKELNFNVIDFYNKFMGSSNIPEVYKQYTYNTDVFWTIVISRKCKSLDFLTNFKHNLDYKELCCNEYAIPLLAEYTDKNNLDWDTLSLNKNAIPILKDNIDKINWEKLSLNSNAIDILKSHKDKIHYENLALNMNAIELLEEYIITNKECSKTFWNNLSTNPNIFHFF